MIGSIIGGVLGIGSSLIGAKKADKASQQQQQMSEATKKELRDLYNPFIDFGKDALGGLGDTLKPLDREAELAAYYQSPEYQMLSSQARNQQLASSEATGGLGGASTQNALASIAPQLGQNFLSQQYANNMNQFNKYMGAAGMGFNAASNLASGLAGQNNIIGAAQAGSTMAQGNAMNQGLGALGGMATGILGSIF